VCRSDGGLQGRTVQRVGDPCQCYVDQAHEQGECRDGANVWIRDRAHHAQEEDARPPKSTSPCLRPRTTRRPQRSTPCACERLRAPRPRTARPIRERTRRTGTDRSRKSSLSPSAPGPRQPGPRGRHDAAVWGPPPPQPTGAPRGSVAAMATRVDSIGPPQDWFVSGVGRHQLR
jgi:hypothetical protein